MNISKIINYFSTSKKSDSFESTRNADGDDKADKETYTSAMMFERGQYGIGLAKAWTILIRFEYWLEFSLLTRPL